MNKEQGIKIAITFAIITGCVGLFVTSGDWDLSRLSTILISLSALAIGFRNIWGTKARLTGPFTFAIIVMAIALTINLGREAGNGDSTSSAAAQAEAEIDSLVAEEKAGTVVHVPANHPFWTETGITLVPGDSITIKAAGKIIWDTAALNTNSGRVGPQGASWAPREVVRPKEFLVPDFAVAGLIGQIGEGKPFGVGQEKKIKIKEEGILKLGINERWFEYCFNDNKGKFVVAVFKHHS